MKIVGGRVSLVESALTRPYRIAGGEWDRARLVIVELRSDEGSIGYGQASPAEEVTGETAERTALELDSHGLGGVLGASLASIVGDAEALKRRLPGPAARAALDMALWDLEAKRRGLALIDCFGRVHADLPTSVTVGLKDVVATLAEADEHYARGFRCLKIKIGEQVELDVERLEKLRERFGSSIALRADANQGYAPRDLARLLARQDRLDLECIEQPLPPSLDRALLDHPPQVRRLFFADESVHDEADLARLAALGSPFGGINVKLMKCGGPSAARRLAEAAHRAGLAILWGCMDESVLGISAALHTALSCAATAQLDLDGSLDLAQDPFTDGFAFVRDGERRDVMRTLASAGLGAEPAGGRPSAKVP